MITYAGTDMLTKLLSGQNGLPVNVMYMEFDNSGSPPTIVPDPADGRNYYEDLESGLSTSDYIRVPLVNTPVLSSDDALKYLSNIATFFAMSTGFSAGLGGKPFTSASNSTVYGIALVCAPSISDRTQDIVFSRDYDFLPILKGAGQEISITQPFGFDFTIVSPGG